MTWTHERRLKQSQAIHRWQPWTKSTGAKTPDGKAKVSKNRCRGYLRKQARLARWLVIKAHDGTDPFTPEFAAEFNRRASPLMPYSLIIAL
jgi:hypothetical protein